MVAADPHPVFRVPGSCQEELQRPIRERLPYRGATPPHFLRFNAKDENTLPAVLQGHTSTSLKEGITK